MVKKQKFIDLSKINERNMDVPHGLGIVDDKSKNDDIKYYGIIFFKSGFFLTRTYAVHHTKSINTLVKWLDMVTEEYYTSDEYCDGLHFLVYETDYEDQSEMDFDEIHRINALDMYNDTSIIEMIYMDGGVGCLRTLENRRLYYDSFAKCKKYFEIKRIQDKMMGKTKRELKDYVISKDIDSRTFLITKSTLIRRIMKHEIAKIMRK
jgi:hypothetical protein